MSFVSSQCEPPFSSPFDHDLFDKKLSLLPSSSDDLFSDVRQDFSRIFHDNNLDIFANATEFGIPEKPDPISTKFEAPASKNPVIGSNNSAIIAPQKDIVQSNMLGTNNGNFLVNSIVPKFQDEFQQPEPKKGIIRKEMIWGIDGFVDSFGDEQLGDMWANDPVKEIKGKQQEQKQAYNNNDVVAYNEYQSFNRKQAIQGQLYMDNYLADILSSMQSLVLGKSGGEVQNVVKGLEHKKSLDMDKNPIEPSQTKLNKNSVKTETDTVTKKKMSRDSFDEDSPEEAGLEKGRSLKGLRVLSMRVKNIVIQKKKTTYKEVADILVKEIASQSKPGSQPDNKDEQNVKRRVYDALNVLIATGILQKEGKLVTYANNPLISSSSSKMDSGLRNGPLGLTLVNAQRRTQIKAQNLHELLYKTLALKSLIKRNKENCINQFPHQQNSYPSLNFQRINAPSSASSNTETIKFPFLVIDSPTPHNSINLDLDVTQKQLSIESTNSLNVSGDIDILLKMKLHNVPRSFFNEHIPKAMQKHVPKSFLENLS